MYRAFVRAQPRKQATLQWLIEEKGAWPQVGDSEFGLSGIGYWTVTGKKCVCIALNFPPRHPCRNLQRAESAVWDAVADLFNVHLHRLLATA